MSCETEIRNKMLSPWLFLYMVLIYGCPVVMSKYGYNTTKHKENNIEKITKARTGDKRFLKIPGQKLLRQEAAVGRQNETENQSNNKLKNLELITKKYIQNPMNKLPKKHVTRPALDASQEHRRRRIRRQQDLHMDSYGEIRNISTLLEPLIHEIIKAEKNQTLFNSTKFEHMKSMLDNYMKTLTTQAPALDKITFSTTPKPRLTTPEPWFYHSTDSNGYIVLGGGEDDEGGDDTDNPEYSGNLSGSGDTNHTGKQAVSIHPSSPAVVDKTLEEEMGFVVVAESSANDKQSARNSTNKNRPTTKALTTKGHISPIPPIKEAFLDINYYGPCLFCKIKETSKTRRKKRKTFRQSLENFDFVLLAQKHPSGIYSAVLSLRSENILFPSHNYIKIHVPLTCGCFASAGNTRYILAGNKMQDKLVLNNYIPLYDITDYKQVQQIHDAMV
ncbi:uncharacterized protein LOC130635498 isoform X1 [Hydractinia symbiolongicarpus]|uniref:uncharacterized protein LOC130635498 isoform X1 n=2 Tax=Hydractinia symbiolongicarpus TaxID=13093 RepID=UPI002550A161|nr:uncharacterized protein LOC130635498 isoform X1 [Hydractinia symbiolongicarpus]